MSEIMVPIQIEPLDEGGYLATSEYLDGLIAQGRTLAETMEIAEGSPNYALHNLGCLQDVARKLIEARIEHGDPLPPAIRTALARREDTVNALIPVEGSPTSALHSLGCLCFRGFTGMSRLSSVPLIFVSYRHSSVFICGSNIFSTIERSLVWLKSLPSVKL